MDQLQVEEALQSGSQALFESRTGLYFSPSPYPHPQGGGLSIQSASGPEVPCAADGRCQSRNQENAEVRVLQTCTR